MKLNIGKNYAQKDSISTFAWAFVLLWTGLVFLAENLGYLYKWRIQISEITAINHLLSAWSLVLLGAGVVFLISSILQIVIPGKHRNLTGSMILSAVALGLGLGQIFSWSLMGPFVLIAIGLSFLLRGIIGR